jgi:hypothetical protein
MELPHGGARRRPLGQESELGVERKLHTSRNRSSADLWLTRPDPWLDRQPRRLTGVIDADNPASNGWADTAPFWQQGSKRVLGGAMRPICGTGGGQRGGSRKPEKRISPSGAGSKPVIRARSPQNQR